MFLQFEDVIGCLKVKHPEYHLVFLFHHSSGHAKQRPDGLNASHQMNKSFGGKSPGMHTTIIGSRESPGFLGFYPCILELGQTQKLSFSDTDIGPFWMTLDERTLNRLDLIIDSDPVTTTKVFSKNKSELLILELHGKVIKTKGKNKKELVGLLCVNNNIGMNRGHIPKIKEGWLGRKTKGLLQVLWERGFIDTNKLSSYTLTGKKNEFGIVDESLSLRHLMSMCPDFLNEEGMMTHRTKLCIEVMLTPICHDEIVGEGIKYMWACSKGAYRNPALKEKKGKENFIESVRKCLSSKVLSVERILNVKSFSMY